MFFKKKKSVQKLETIIGKDSCLKGELNVQGTLRIDGRLDGDLCADWVVVGETGVIKGNVRARGMIVGGVIEGNLDAEEIIELKCKAQITGEINAVKIAMSEGAMFEGRSSMKKAAEGRIIQLQSSSSSSSS